MNPTHHDEADILFACPQCRQELSCPSVFAGRKFHCPECSTMDFVPDQGATNGERVRMTGSAIHLFPQRQGRKTPAKWVAAKSEFPLRPMKNVTNGNKVKGRREATATARQQAAEVREEQLVLENVSPDPPARPNGRDLRRSKALAKETMNGTTKSAAAAPTPAGDAPEEPAGPRKTVGEILQSLEAHGFEVKVSCPPAPGHTPRNGAQRTS